MDWRVSTIYKSLEQLILTSKRSLCCPKLSQELPDIEVRKVVPFTDLYNLIKVQRIWICTKAEAHKQFSRRSNLGDAVSRMSTFTQNDIFVFWGPDVIADSANSTVHACAAIQAALSTCDRLLLRLPITRSAALQPPFVPSFSLTLMDRHGIGRILNSFRTAFD